MGVALDQGNVSGSACSREIDASRHLADCFVTPRSWYISQPKEVEELVEALEHFIPLLGVVFALVVPIMLVLNIKRINKGICPNIIKCSDVCIIEADPDIGGIGVSPPHLAGRASTNHQSQFQVRSAAYIQSLCSLFLFGLGSKYDGALRGTLVLTSLALVASIAIFSIQSELSLHHATVSLTLLTVVMLPLHFVESWRIESPGLFVAQQLRLGTYSAMQIWLAVQAPCFGSTPECNLCTKTGALWYSFNVVSDWGLMSRVAAVFIVGISWVKSTFLTYGPLHSIQAVPAMFSKLRAERWSEFARSTQSDLMEWRRERLRGFRRRGERKGGTWTHVFIWYEDTTSVKAVIGARRWARPPKRQKEAPGWLQRVWSDLRMASTAPRFHRMVISLVFSVVYICNTEYTVRINLDDGASAWGFGQILSMATAVPFMASIIELVFRLGARDRSVKSIHNCGLRC